MNVGVAPKLFHIIMCVKAVRYVCLKTAVLRCGFEKKLSWLDACQKHVGAGLFETHPYRDSR